MNTKSIDSKEIAQINRNNDRRQTFTEYFNSLLTVEEFMKQLKEKEAKEKVA